MSRDYKVYLDDILGAVYKIKKYTKGMSESKFYKDDKTIDAVVRNLAIIGEAVKKLPSEIRIKHNEIDWKKIAGMRDLLVHEYFEIDSEIIWDIIKSKLDGLEESVGKILKTRK